MCMDCFNTIGDINRQHEEKYRSPHCGNCQDWTEDNDFNVFGKCSHDELCKGRHHFCGKWKRKGN